MAKIRPKLKKQILTMTVVTVAMFGFCYAMVPLYNVFCQAVGINGKTSNKVQPMISKVDKSRTITVELLATLNQDMPGEFSPGTKKFTLHPGEYVSTEYWVKNLTDKPMTVQAIPSVTPSIAAKHIKKVECFCFQKQHLAPNEGVNMPLKFTVDPIVSTKVNTVTLAYTLFDVTQS